MKKTLIASVAVLALAVGCSNKKSTTASSQSPLTDIAPPPPVTSTTSTPVTNAMPVTPVEATPVETPTAGTLTAGQKYVVKQGDTLWNIAQRTYGDGKQYTKIKKANPSIKGTEIKAGQTITLP